MSMEIKSRFSRKAGAIFMKCYILLPVKYKYVLLLNAGLLLESLMLVKDFMFPCIFFVVLLLVLCCFIKIL